MLNLLTFLLFTIFHVFAVGCLAMALFFSIQEGQWLDKLFGWQDMLDSLYASKRPSRKALFNLLGGCAMCSAHFVSFMSFWLYVLLMRVGLHLWITDTISNVLLACIINFFWMILVDSLATMVGWKIISKYLNGNK